MTNVTAQEFGARLRALELFVNSLEGGIVLRSWETCYYKTIDALEHKQNNAEVKLQELKYSGN